ARVVKSMAKQPIKSSDDPASLAFSAVENALKDSVFKDDKPAAGSPAAIREARGKSAPQERLRSAERIANQTSNFANDDRFSSSRLLYGMQSRASGLPVYVAVLCAALWIAAAFAIG